LPSSSYPSASLSGFSFVCDYYTSASILLIKQI
jgi:hypothetical protein